MIKYILLLISIFLNLSYTKAQSSNNASGNDIYNNYGSIAHSVGEVFYVQKGTKYTLTEGMQNGITINAIHKLSTIKVSIYPNPTSDFVHFRVQNLYFKNLAYKIYDALGKELLNGNIIDANTSVSLSHLPASIYIIKIYRDVEEIQNYQIIKIN